MIGAIEKILKKNQVNCRKEEFQRFVEEAVKLLSVPYSKEYVVSELWSSRSFGVSLNDIFLSVECAEKISGEKI